jgi:hypothetical protein
MTASSIGEPSDWNAGALAGQSDGVFENESGTTIRSAHEHGLPMKSWVPHG